MFKFFTFYLKFFLLIIILLTFVSVNNLYSINSKDFVVFLTAEVTKTPTPSIKINWTTTGYAKEYQVYRKLKESTYWGSPITTLDKTANSYTDKNVTVGDAYEYQVLAYSQIPDAVLDTINYYAVGYIYTGIEVKPKDSYGTVLLLVEENLKYYVPNELKRLEEDLIAEGWMVIRKDVPRGDSSFNGSPVEVRNIVKQEYLKDNNLNTVFIIGRVPVPYSGNFNPDAHPDHKGAWPSDVYYGIFDDSYWSDISINTDNNPTKPSRKENENRPGDGKFDQSYIREGDVALGIGRVDFYNMPAFSKNEYDLLKQYLDKDHAYRTGEMPVVNRGLVDINFQPSYSSQQEDYLELNFGSSGWRNFGSFFGLDSIKNVDWFTTLKNDVYLWAYGCGGGSYTSAGGIGYTSNFADTTPKNAIFTMLFGSYFGDWDSKNNFLRAGLCSSPSILTCAWAGRPQWYLHHMALGEPIGYSTRISQNNQSTYIPNIIYTPNYPNGVVYTYGNLMAHVSLMGDPTLRMNMVKQQGTGEVPEVKNLSVIRVAGNKVEISWEKPDEQTEYFYNVYFSLKEDGPFAKINQNLLTDTNYTDTEIRGSKVYYLVRAYKVEITPSGSFYNSGRGIMKSIQSTDVNEPVKIQNSLAVSPNPATANVNIELSLKEEAAVSLDIFDINGNRVVNICSRNLAGGTHSFAWNMLNGRNQKVSPGVYFVKLTGIGISNAVKLIVMP